LDFLAATRFFAFAAALGPFALTADLPLFLLPNAPSQPSEYFFVGPTRTIVTAFSFRTWLNLD
jgi:hypothetical protein